MFVIGIKSQYVSLIVTVVNAAAEICASDAFLLVNSEFECRGLDRARPLSARRHRTVKLLLLATSLVLFFGIELVVGFFMDADTQQVPLIKPCERLGLKTDTKFGSFEKPYKAHSAVFSCSRSVDDRMLIYLANSSLVDAEVRCAETPSCEIPVGVDVRSLNGSTKHCLLGICTFTKLSDDVFSFSTIVSEENEVDEIGFYDVKLFFEPSDQETISRSVLQSAITSRSEYDAFVSNVFFGSFSTSCEFFESKDVTTIPLFLFVLLVLMWCLSFGIYVVLTLRRRSKPLFFDIGDPTNWALVRLPSVADHEEKVVHDGFVHAKKSDGTRVLYATLS